MLMSLPRRVLSSRKQLLFTMSVVLLAVVLIVGGVIGVRAWQSLSHVMPGGGSTEPVNGRYTIALLGADSATWRDGARIDSITVASVDAVTGRTLLISIPRNLTLIPFPTTSPLYGLYPDGYRCPDQERAPCMLTMVYQTGLDHPGLYPDIVDPGAQATVDALEGITGLSINYWAMVNMDGFTSLIDAVGGIDVMIPQRTPVGAVDNTFYWIEAGTHHFSGDEALWYARTRIDTDDYTRMGRQKCIMMAVLDELDPATVATHFLALTDAAPDTVSSNIPTSQISTLLNLANQARTWSVSGLTLTPPKVDPLNPDYDAIHSQVSSAVSYVESLDTGHATPNTDLTADMLGTCGL